MGQKYKTLAIKKASELEQHLKRCHIGDFANTVAVGQLLEALERFTGGPGLIDGLDRAERDYMNSGNKIGAIKHMRNRTGLNLGEAKDVCEQYAHKYL